jgi:hypothetical protein
MIYFYFLLIIIIFYITFISYFLLWKLNPFQNVRTNLIFKFDAQWKPRWFSLSGSHQAIIISN